MSLDQIINSHFKKSNTKTRDERLCLLKNGELISGYNGPRNNIQYYTHINYHSMKKALELVSELHTKPIIVETGCAAHGTKSTLLWDKYANLTGGEVHSVDLNPKAVQETQKYVSKATCVVNSDSLVFLKDFDKPIHFLYLDSYDCVFVRDNGSAEHHFKEFMLCLNNLVDNCVILIDDTPLNRYWLDDGQYSPFFNKFRDNQEIFGKGNLVNEYLEKNTNSRKVLHQYQTLWIYKK